MGLSIGLPLHLLSIDLLQLYTSLLLPLLLTNPLQLPTSLPLLLTNLMWTPTLQRRPSTPTPMVSRMITPAMTLEPRRPEMVSSLMENTQLPFLMEEFRLSLTLSMEEKVM